MIAQRHALELAAEQAAVLQDRHDVIDYQSLSSGTVAGCRVKL